MTNKLNWDRHQRRNKLDEYFRSTDNRVRFGHSLIEKQEKEAAEWLKLHPDHNVKQVKNEKMLKLASKLYKTLQTQPDFRDTDKTELWELALAEAKRSCRN